jgi:hypothetical protein
MATSGEVKFYFILPAAQLLKARDKVGILFLSEYDLFLWGSWHL